MVVALALNITLDYIKCLVLFLWSILLAAHSIVNIRYNIFLKTYYVCDTRSYRSYSCEEYQPGKADQPK